MTYRWPCPIQVSSKLAGSDILIREARQRLPRKEGRGHTHTCRMTESELENAAADMRSENMGDVLEALICGRNVFFVKKLGPTHVPRVNDACNGLVLPPWFVEENMESLCKTVVLVTSEAWELRFSITPSKRVTPVVVFSGGWEAFAISNNLALGDQLIFKFSGISQFDVYIFNADGTPKRLGRTNEAPMEWSDGSEQPKVKRIKSSHFTQDWPVVDDSEASANELRGSIAKEEIQELPEEQEIDADECKNQSPKLDQKLHPRFIKRLKPSNFRSSHALPYLVSSLRKEPEVACSPGYDYAEIPTKFARTHSSRLQTPVKLQGIRDESPVYTVTYARWERNSAPNRYPRVFLRAGWKEFCDANGLELGQELEFTLVSDSFFAVREGAQKNDPEVPASELPTLEDSSPDDPDMTVNSQATGCVGAFVKEESQERPDKHEDDAEECQNHSPMVSPILQYPSFIRRLTSNNFWRSGSAGCQLEVPAKFVWTFGNLLQSLVKLQGIYEDSPVCTVACRFGKSSTERRPPRLFLRAGWKEFVDSCGLEIGQELQFTLMFDSLFVVRKRAG